MLQEHARHQQERKQHLVLLKQALAHLDRFGFAKELVQKSTATHLQMSTDVWGPEMVPGSVHRCMGLRLLRSSCGVQKCRHTTLYLSVMELWMISPHLPVQEEGEEAIEALCALLDVVLFWAAIHAPHAPTTAHQCVPSSGRRVTPGVAAVLAYRD